MRRFFSYLAALVVLSSLVGCAGRANIESFAREDVDLSYVSSIAVIPFQNNSKDMFAAERVRDIAITQVLANGMFDVIDKGLVDSMLHEEAISIEKEPMDKAIIKRIGQRLNVQALLMGTIDQAGLVQRGPSSYPQLSLTLRLVDINTGMIFWQASGSRAGDSISKRLFGLNTEDEFHVSLALLRHLLSTLPVEGGIDQDNSGEEIDDATDGDPVDVDVEVIDQG